MRVVWHKIKHGESYPFEVTLDNLSDVPCRFEISRPLEKFRILELGDEDEFVRSVVNSLQPSDVFFDIGSCVGIVAIPAATTGATVYGFEPDPSYRGRLERNLVLNQLDNLHVVDWAVSDERSTVTLFTDGVGGTSPSLAKVGKRGDVEVPTNSIDDAIAEGVLPVPNVVKIDIEGAEILALRGMQKLMHSDNAPRKIFCEIHPVFLEQFGATKEDCLTLFESAGYKRTLWEERDNEIHTVFEK